MQSQDGKLSLKEGQASRHANVSDGLRVQQAMSRRAAAAEIAGIALRRLAEVAASCGLSTLFLVRAPGNWAEPPRPLDLAGDLPRPLGEPLEGPDRLTRSGTVRGEIMITRQGGTQLVGYAHPQLLVSAVSCSKATGVKPWASPLYLVHSPVTRAQAG